MDEILSMIDELKSNGISINDLQLQKFVEVYRYIENMAQVFGGVLERPEYSLKGCGLEFRCDYLSNLDDIKAFADLLRCCSELEIHPAQDNRFAMRFLVPGVFNRGDG